MVSRISRIWKLSRPRTRVPATPWICCKTILNFMIGRKRPRLRNRRLNTLLRSVWERHWLLASAAVCAAAFAGPPPPATPAVPPPASSPHGAPPDDDFIEFLGRDDVGDAAWWEFLKRVPPRGQKPPEAPTQEAKQ